MKMTFKIKMGKTILSVLVLLVYLTSCGLKMKSNDTRILTYSIELEILSDTIPKDAKAYLNQKHGDSVQITYDSRGNIRMNYFGSGSSGMEYNIYNAQKHLMYAKWKNRDTTYYYNTIINEYHLDSTQRIEESNRFILKYYSQNPHANGNIIQEFQFINDSLIVNSKLYKDFKDFAFADIIKESKLLPIKTIMTTESIRLTKKTNKCEN
jgi:hypothetical protein